MHFSEFVKLDLFVYYPSDLVANVWLKDILIVQDDFKILHYLHELYRRFKRKEYHYCVHCALMMKHTLISLWLIEMGDIPNDLGDWSKYEGSRSSLTFKQKEFIDMYTPVNFENVNTFVECMNREIVKTGKTISRNMEFNLNTETYRSLFDLKF